MITGNVLNLDTETSGLSVAKGAVCIEVGAILYNIEHKAMLQCMSTLLPCNSNPVEHINGINAALTQKTMYIDHTMLFLNEMAMACDAVVAHNASFDLQFMKTLY